MDVLPSALKHGVLVDDIEHAVRNVMVIDELDDDLRLSSVPAEAAHCSRSSPSCVKVIAATLVIHAMAMRPKYRRLLPGG